VYLIEATGRGVSAWGVVNITNLAVVAKRSPKRLLAWVTDFRTGVPVAGASVALWNRFSDAAHSSNAIVRAKPEKDGALVLAAAPQTYETLVVSRGGDNAAVSLTVENPDNKLKMHFQTDRPFIGPASACSSKQFCAARKAVVGRRLPIHRVPFSARCARRSFDGTTDQDKRAGDTGRPS
jgi:hypothetical protein